MGSHDKVVNVAELSENTLKNYTEYEINNATSMIDREKTPITFLKTVADKFSNSNQVSGRNMVKDLSKIEQDLGQKVQYANENLYNLKRSISELCNDEEGNKSYGKLCNSKKQGGQGNEIETDLEFVEQLIDKLDNYNKNLDIVTTIDSIENSIEEILKQPTDNSINNTDKIKLSNYKPFSDKNNIFKLNNFTYNNKFISSKKNDSTAAAFKAYYSSVKEINENELIKDLTGKIKDVEDDMKKMRDMIKNKKYLKTSSKFLTDIRKNVNEFSSKEKEVIKIIKGRLNTLKLYLKSINDTIDTANEKGNKSNNDTGNNDRMSVEFKERVEMKNKIDEKIDNLGKNYNSDIKFTSFDKDKVTNNEIVESNDNTGITLSGLKEVSDKDLNINSEKHSDFVEIYKKFNLYLAKVELF